LRFSAFAKASAGQAAFVKASADKPPSPRLRRDKLLSIQSPPIRRHYRKPDAGDTVENASLTAKRRYDMRVMILIKSDKNTESGALPDEKLLTDMGKFNEELVKAGVMLAGEGLHPSSRGARVKFSGTKRTVVDGPFAEAKELIAGFWIWKVKSKEEAIEWVKRIPNPTGQEGEVEIREIQEADDLGAGFTPELREQEERLRAEIAARQ
jgi:hypothetical protein